MSRLNWDLLPEEFPYEDAGCEMASSCLECPYPKCLEDEPRGKQKHSRRSRDESIREMRREGKSVAEIATIYDVSKRTVSRALERTADPGASVRGPS